ncbi:MAG: carbon-nitrogen hydrolase [Planctomycetes bacterium]|nr:carbon-nitrogen hydrolase [Planctomycetota bacterium]
MKNAHILLAQTAPALGNVERNLEQHLAILKRAAKERADLVVFPELSLTGYFLNDLTDDVAMAPTHPAVLKIVKASKGRAAVFGFVERAPDHRVYNSTAYAEDGKILHIHRKVHLPTYGIFDDARYLAAGSTFRAFDAKFGRVGVLICEDAWHLASSYLLFLQNVDLIVCVSASPGRGLTERGDVSASRSWEAILEAQAALFQTFVIYCNRTGVEDGVTFFGGSRVIDPFGNVLARAAELEEGVASATLEDEALRRARVFAPMRRDERPELVLRELRRIVEEA